MDKKVMAKILIAVFLLAILSLFVIAPIKQTARVCAQYHQKSCNWFYPQTSQCLCEGEKLFLTQEMVTERKDAMESSITVIYSGYNLPNLTGYNFTAR